MKLNQYYWFHAEFEIDRSFQCWLFNEIHGMKWKNAENGTFVWKYYFWFGLSERISTIAICFLHGFQIWWHNLNEFISDNIEMNCLFDRMDDEKRYAYFIPFILPSQHTNFDWIICINLSWDVCLCILTLGISKV